MPHYPEEESRPRVSPGGTTRPPVRSLLVPPPPAEAQAPQKGPSLGPRASLPPLGNGATQKREEGQMSPRGGRRGVGC